MEQIIINGHECEIVFNGEDKEWIVTTKDYPYCSSICGTKKEALREFEILLKYVDDIINKRNRKLH